METRERIAAERIVLQVEMGIRDLHNRRTVNHKEFMLKVEDFIKEVLQLKIELQQTMKPQVRNSKHLVDETHATYETGFAILQETIKGLRRSLTAKVIVDEILHLTKEIHQNLFSNAIPNNQ